jgi:hypothetical protein
MDGENIVQPAVVPEGTPATTPEIAGNTGSKSRGQTGNSTFNPRTSCQDGSGGGSHSD